MKKEVVREKIIYREAPRQKSSWDIIGDIILTIIKVVLVVFVIILVSSFGYVFIQDWAGRIFLIIVVAVILIIWFATRKKNKKKERKK